jgi:hypothetical protein
VLAVIQRQQQPAVPDIIAEHLADRQATRLLQAQGGSHGTGNLSLVRQVGQFHQPDAVLELVQHLPRYHLRQAGLSGAARAGQRYQATGGFRE